MKWITRAKVKVDRVACPWLIKKFVDPQAEFLFVPAEQVLEIAAREGAVPFDVAGVELGHHEGKCSFEAILSRYGLNDPPCTCSPRSFTARMCLRISTAGPRLPD
jgi:hypothetical protein